MYYMHLYGEIRKSIILLYMVFADPIKTCATHNIFNGFSFKQKKSFVFKLRDELLTVIKVTLKKRKGAR